MATPIVILDNGAGSIKYGYHDTDQPAAMPNCSATVNKSMTAYVGDQFENAGDGALLTISRPFERGYLTKWGIQLQMWNRIFSHPYLDVKPKDSILVVTEPPFNPEPLQNDMNEVIFEDYGFMEYMRRIPAWFSAYNHFHAPEFSPLHSSCCTVVDSGFSFTHIFPFINGVCMKPAVSCALHFPYFVTHLFLFLICQ
jgi:actin-related protein 6